MEILAFRLKHINRYIACQKERFVCLKCTFEYKAYSNTSIFIYTVLITEGNDLCD